jgi:CheY-like chemotaxis protein
MLKEFRVLLVEDAPINAEVAGEILRGAGYEFDVVEDGGDAVDAVRRTEYGIVLMDCQLPRVDGYEATRRIRALEAERAIAGAAHAGACMRLPILAVTACASPDDRERAAAAGMDELLVKPVDAPRLLSAIARHAAR